MGIDSLVKVSEQCLIAWGVQDCQGRLHAGRERGLATRLRGSRDGAQVINTRWDSCSQTSKIARMDMLSVSNGS